MPIPVITLPNWSITIAEMGTCRYRTVNCIQPLAGGASPSRLASFRQTSRQPVGARIEWLLKNEQHVFAFHQLEKVACPQKVQLPAEKAEQIMRLFEVAGLVHH